MANLFDDANAPETEPAIIVAGDQVKWKRTDLGTDYPPGHIGAAAGGSKKPLVLRLSSLVPRIATSTKFN